MTSAPPGRRPRPREVTFGGTQAVVGGAIGLVLLIGAARQLYSQDMGDVLKKAVNTAQARQLGITISTARTIAKATIMVTGVMSVTSFILGIYVLKRHRPARTVLTILGVLVAVATLFAGPSGWAITLYVGGSIGLLWSRAARAWFADSPPGQRYGHPPT